MMVTKSIYKSQLHFYILQQSEKINFQDIIYNSNKNIKYLEINLTKYILKIFQGKIIKLY